VSGNAVPLIMLSDAERSVIKRYDVYNPSEHGGVAIPAVFIIDKSGAVRFAHVERTIIRVRNKTLLEEAKKL
jgi:peroxiredoxin